MVVIHKTSYLQEVINNYNPYTLSQQERRKRKDKKSGQETG